MNIIQARSRPAIVLASIALIVAACGGSTTTTAPAATGGGPAGSGAAASGGGTTTGGELSVWTAWGGQELKGFQAVLKPFTDQTGIKVNLLTIRDQDTQLSNNVAAGLPLPDIANPPNPSRYEEWATKGIMKPLEDFLDMNAYTASTLPGLLAQDPNYGFIGGKHYLEMVKSQLKGLIWYNPKTFTATPPATWDDMLAVQPPSGTNLFCAAFESGAASGWPASDDLANIVMRQAGEKVYVDWYSGKVKWTDPAIKTAYQTFGQMVKDSNLYGGTNYALSTNFGKAGDGLFSTPPGCLFMEQATFIPSFFETDNPELKGQGGTGYNFFSHPKFNDQFAGNVEGFFDTFVMYNDTPQARALMQYMVTDPAQQIWVDNGATLAASKNITKYPDALGGNASKILLASKNILLTAGDYMPTDMQKAFWKSLLDFTNDQTKLDSILANLDTVQSTAYTK